MKAPSLEAPAPASPQPGNTIPFVKAAGTTEVKPTVPERAPKTSYDVDIYHVKDGDTYESISQEWYNSKKYATALRSYNQSQSLQGGRYVNVPPKYVLERQFPTVTGGTNGTRAAPPVDGANWSAPATKPPAGTSGRGVYVVPRGGRTLQQIAYETMGDFQRWREISARNDHIPNTNQPLAEGTELKLPPDAKLP
ncbi:hypothetical protein R5W24_004934 [Gemmata sp. JC717]|uniref:hypothetical protein n=1 Tax=Gemmata algarum TaxID=2975278 RepID=UPI0021BACB7C|nr:hypothetical protein [Gemmata algarum]MDY3555788.1 hypothetical protein [Gemmata algarum]